MDDNVEVNLEGKGLAGHRVKSSASGHKCEVGRQAVLSEVLVPCYLCTLGKWLNLPTSVSLPVKWDDIYGAAASIY